MGNGNIQHTTAPEQIGQGLLIKHNANTGLTDELPAEYVHKQILRKNWHSLRWHFHNN